MGQSYISYIVKPLIILISWGLFQRALSRVKVDQLDQKKKEPKRIKVINGNTGLSQSFFGCFCHESFAYTF